MALTTRGTIAALGAVALGIGAAQAAPCGRDCLAGLIDRYLVAMVKHDPAGLLLPCGAQSGWD